MFLKVLCPLKSSGHKAVAEIVGLRKPTSRPDMDSLDHKDLIPKLFRIRADKTRLKDQMWKISKGKMKHTGPQESNNYKN